MSEDRYLEDYEIGEERGTTGRTITEADIVLHAGQTGDFYPHHMDAEWCASQPFKQRIAHGTLVFSVAIGMAANVINPRSMSYGYDRLRTTIKEKRAHKRPGYGILVEKVDVVKQGDELVLTCEHIHLVEMRAPLGASA
jgi:acyl dehydratase